MAKRHPEEVDLTSPRAGEAKIHRSTPSHHRAAYDLTADEIDLTASQRGTDAARSSPQRGGAHSAPAGRHRTRHLQEDARRVAEAPNRCQAAMAGAEASEALQHHIGWQQLEQQEADTDARSLALARHLQAEDDRRVAEREAALQRRMEHLERQEAETEAASMALFGSMFGRRSRSNAGAAAAMGPRAEGHGTHARATGPRSANRRRAARWGDLMQGRGSGAGAGLGPLGLFGGMHLPPALHQAMLSAQSGLPSSLLFSDRDFTDAGLLLLAASHSPPLAATCRGAMSGVATACVVD